MQKTIQPLSVFALLKNFVQINKTWLILMLVGMAGLGQLIVEPVQAAALGGKTGDVVFTDDFSRGLDKWEVSRGQTTMWKEENGTAQGLISTPFTLSELVPKQEFWDPAWRNYEFEVDMLPLSGVDHNLAWGYQNPNNWYEVHFLPSFFELALLRNGTVDWAQRQNLLFSNGQWRHIKIRTTGGQLQMWVDGVPVYTFSDPEYAENPGSIALKVGTGTIFPTTVQFDNVQVRLVADARDVVLDVPHVRQDDVAWAELTYDKAEDWATDQAATIERWGCALTSAVMMLRFHGFNQLADGQMMTPETLNAWLLTQKDGYVGSGSVNWVAIVRLARELREKFSTIAKPLPQIAYAYQGWTDWMTGKNLLRSQIDKKQPAIVQVPGHFIVARGYTKNMEDILVRDPASNAENVTEVNKPAQSARIFSATLEPELVALNYWLVVLPKGLRIRVFNDYGGMLSGWWVAQDLPGAETPAEGSNLVGAPDNWVTVTLPHPPKGRFKFEISRATGDEVSDGALFPVADLPDFVPFELQFFAYDKKANVVTWKKSGSLSNSNQATASWIFTTEDEIDGITTPPSFQADFSWSQWRTSLREVAQEQKLPKLAVARLDQVAELAQVTEQELGGGQVPPPEPNILAAQLKTNQRYANWLATILDQIGQNWPTLQGSLEVSHLRSELSRWLDEEDQV